MAAAMRQPAQGLGGAPRVSEFLRGISLEYPIEELAASTSNWSSARRLGSGSYGAVYKGEMKDGSEVAIKSIDLGALGAQGQTPDMAGFEEEVQTLSKFRHPNLVTLLGWGKHGKFRYLIYELMKGGDVFERLLKSRKSIDPKPFYWHERLSALLDAATGLSHMHNSKPKAFHRDIKSANILLDRHGTAKMADFGLSCTSSGKGKGGDSVKVKTISGTPGYACPLYSRSGNVTEGSEVYSFGMVILEVLTGLAPASADSKAPGGIVYPIAEKIVPGSPGALDRVGRVLDTSANWPSPVFEELATMGLRCIHATDESQRPRFVEVVRPLRNLLERFPPESAIQDSTSPPRPQDKANYRGVNYGGYGGQSGGSPYSAADASSPMHLSADAALCLAASSTSPFVLELIAAEDLDVDSLPAERRRLCLTPYVSEVDGRHVAPVGRQHQQDLFESWLAKPELRSCISRVAFEISWLGSARDPQIVAKGNNPIAINGRVLQRNEIVSLCLGSEVGFAYSNAGEIDLFVKLRFAPAPHAAVVAASAPTAALVNMDRSETSRAKKTGKTGPKSWVLRCSFVEGLTSEEIAGLPQSAREFTVEENGQLIIGRQHQPKELEILLSKAPACMSFISRSHVQFEAQGDVLIASNVSSNPVYVDGEPLGRGELRQLTDKNIISFARLEGSTHALFISLVVLASS
eukprot:TRINITY_DN5152_c0_g3_i1.p1 TRINITY_DN5152_c0_g3~~TRINITY_DN5152_c0_g3_i1.p1  ORF type:complete len:691 (+),score=109.48 TRINITY_DN5152_c0_g3_i1:44-2116(+)